MMRKRLLTKILVMLLTLEAAAGGIPYDELDGLYEWKWTPLQLSLGPGGALFTSGTPVYGVSLGYSFAVQGQVAGLNFASVTMTRQTAGMTLALLCNIYEENYGVAVSLVNLAVHDYAGVQLGLWNMNSSLDAGGGQFGVVNVARRGWQFGLVNMAGCGWQFGLVNINSNPDALLPWSLIFNYSPESGKTD